jgi:hypothetical protein
MRINQILLTKCTLLNIATLFSIDCVDEQNVEVMIEMD